MTSAWHTYIRHLQARMYPQTQFFFILLTRTRDTRTSHFTFQDISSNIVRCSDPSDAGLSRRCFQLLLHSTLMTVCSYICGTWVCVRINLTPQATAARGSCFVFTSCVNNRGGQVRVCMQHSGQGNTDTGTLNRFTVSPYTCACNSQ